MHGATIKIKKKLYNRFEDVIFTQFNVKMPTIAQILKYKLPRKIHEYSDMFRSLSGHPQGVYIKQAYVQHRFYQTD